MKILKISGKNVASLAGEFSVDFEQKPLAGAGLFAISGPTGAGKSTLLDVLCLALYDATPRLPKMRSGAYLPDVGVETVGAHDSRTLLRRGSSEGYAEVDFVGNDDVRYRARWQVRRSRGKTGGALQKVAMSLHQLPALTALGGTNTEVLKEIVSRVGLSFEQFTRAVLLAQNEFSAFLNTEENERGALLETLTGSAIYSALSRRAHERFHAEKSAMQQLSARLADHTPLSAEARCALDADCAAASAALALADARKSTLEQHLRWHQEADKLAYNEAQAEQLLADARAAVAAAGERRRQVATRDAVEPARALHADSERLAREHVAISNALDAAALELARTLALQEQAGANLAAAMTSLGTAEAAQAQAAPRLDEAKALDASIAALAPSHEQSRQAHAGAGAALTLAVSALTEKTAKLRALQAEHAAGEAWLTSHTQHQQLALQWPRWETLFHQADAGATLQARLAAELKGAALALQGAQAGEQRAASALAASADTLAGLEAVRQHAIGALAAFDGDQLHRARDQLELRRESLVGAEKHWTELAATQERLELARTQAANLAGAQAQGTAALVAASAAAPSIAGALAQSERSLRAAELACADSVVELRARLADDEPCPVCGSAEHPYQHQNAGLHDMLASLQAEVTRCRAAAQDNASVQAAQNALLAGHAQQLAALQHEQGLLAESIARLQHAWDTLALAAEAPPAPERAAWFALQLDTVRARSKDLDTHEHGARQAASARDLAQRACDSSAADHARAHLLATSARETLSQASSRHAALLDQDTRAGEQVARLLAELDGAMAHMPDWQRQWRAGPAQFHLAREADATAWRTQSTRHASRAAALSAHEAEVAAAGQRQQHLEGAHATAGAEFARLDADIGAKRAKRAALWGGRAVRDVEQELAAAVGAARAVLAAQQSTKQLAAQAEARARESQAQLQARLASVQEQAGAASAILASWLASYPQRHPDLDPVPDAEALAALLALDSTTLGHERTALQALDAAASTALTVLGERRTQRALHRQSAPPADALDAAALGAALDALLLERKLAHDNATALRLQLAQDEVRRQNAQAMMVEIDKQQQIELRWGRMNELIGSADGKKFRNYAQQFTLDVLLGYANAHLARLAKRYRLERVVASSGPSLGLMVRDQDMGGEVRSVNSLSGGESFLVSLALALGLASLSSNRVRVESLFIDEGFGSLDSETLRVAIDALDNLQSMGRKVGVISHVQEMTERIATRIIVQPAGGGVSSVTVQ